MPDFVVSAHARDMLAERNISEEWIWRALNSPDKKHMGKDGNLHFTKAIKEKEGRVFAHCCQSKCISKSYCYPFLRPSLRKKP